MEALTKEGCLWEVVEGMPQQSLPKPCDRQPGLGIRVKWAQAENKMSDFRNTSVCSQRKRQYSAHLLFCTEK